MIDLQDLQFRWSRSGPPVLVLPSLHIGDGERVFIEGPSGSGKTTLLNLLGGIVLPERGQIAICGQDLKLLRQAERDAFRAKHIGFIFQMFNLVPYLSILDNVTLPCRFSEARRAQAGARSGDPESEARRLLSHMGLDAEQFGNRPVTQLSVGQQQRVAAARSLIGGPALVIADEPTSALDSGTRAGFLDLLFEEIERTGATLVFVSHDSALGQRFDRTLSLPELNKAA